MHTDASGRTDHPAPTPTRRRARPTAVLAVAAAFLAACGGGAAHATNPADRSGAPPAVTSRTTTTLSGADQQVLASAVTQATAICAQAVTKVAPVLVVAPDANALSAASSTIRAVLDGEVAQMASLTLPATELPVTQQIARNADQSRSDLDRSGQRLADGDLTAAAALYQDAVDHLGQIASIVRQLGGTCTGSPHPTRNGAIAPDAIVDVGTYASQITAAGDAVWVALQDGRSIVRLDARTNSVVATIPVDDEDLRTIQVTTDGVWVRGATAIHAIDPATNRETRSVAKSAIGTNVTRAFVDDGSIWACDGSSVVRASKVDGHPTATITLPYTCGTVSSAGGQVWVTSDVGQPGQITHIDAASSTIVGTWPIAADAATFPAIGAAAVWTHSQAGSDGALAVAVDPVSGEVVQTATLKSGSGPGALTTTYYYAATTDQGLVEGINVANGLIERTYDGGAEPNAVAISGKTLWVADEAAGQVRRFDLP